jgi:PAS domain S-box-containing protein
MLFHGLHDCVLFALLTVFVLLTTYAAIAQVSWKGRCRRILWLAPAGTLSAAGWAGYHFAPDRFEILDHYTSIMLAIAVASWTSWFVVQRTKRQNLENNNAASSQALAEAIPQIVWIADANGRTTYINRRWYEMTGTPQDGDVETSWMESVHADDRAAMVERWERCVRLCETFEIEYRLHDATRGYRWSLDRAVPLRDEKGMIQQWFGNLHRYRGAEALSTNPRAADQRTD